MKKKFTKLEKELLDIVNILVFWGEHQEKCDKVWHHNMDLHCTCKRGQGLVNGNILLNKFGMGYFLHEVDKKWIQTTSYFKDTE